MIKLIAISMTLAVNALAADGTANPDVKALRDKGMGWGEIGHAVAISERSGKPLDEVVKLREGGMGWGKIAKEYGFKLGEVKGRAKEFERVHKEPKAGREPKHDRHGHHGGHSHGHDSGPKREPGAKEPRGRK